MTDLAPTPQDSTPPPLLSPHPPPIIPSGALIHPFQVIFLSQQCLRCVCFNSAWDILLKPLTTVSVAQKTQLPSAVTRPVGFPALWLHGTCQHLGKERENNDSLGLSCSFIQIVSFTMLGYIRGGWREKMNSDSPSSCLVFNSAALRCSASL